MDYRPTIIIFDLDSMTPLDVATEALYLFVILVTLIVRHKTFSISGGVSLQLKKPNVLQALPYVY